MARKPQIDESLYVELGALNIYNAPTARMPLDLTDTAKINQWRGTRDRLKDEASARRAADRALAEELAGALPGMMAQIIEKNESHSPYGELFRDHKVSIEFMQPDPKHSYWLASVDGFILDDFGSLPQAIKEARAYVDGMIADFVTQDGRSGDLPVVSAYPDLWAEDYNGSTIEYERLPIDRHPSEPEKWTIRINGALCGHASPVSAAIDLARATINARNNRSNPCPPFQGQTIEGLHKGRIIHLVCAGNDFDSRLHWEILIDRVNVGAHGGTADEALTIAQQKIDTYYNKPGTMEHARANNLPWPPRPDLEPQPPAKESTMPPEATRPPFDGESYARDLLAALRGLSEAQDVKERNYQKARTAKGQLDEYESAVLAGVTAETDSAGKKTHSNADARKAETQRRMCEYHYPIIRAAEEAADDLRTASAAFDLAFETLKTLRSLLNHKTALVHLEGEQVRAANIRKLAGQGLPWDD